MMSFSFTFDKIRPLISHHNQISLHFPSPVYLSANSISISAFRCHRSLKLKNRNTTTTAVIKTKTSHGRNDGEEDGESGNGIPCEDVKVLAKFKSLYNYIRVLEVSRRADHPFAGSRLLLLDRPGNIHSISFLFKSLTGTYFDVFATLPPILPPGPVGILGFGAGSSAKLLLELYPQLVVHGWELDPSVIAVGREFFGLRKLEKECDGRLFIHIGDALMAGVRDGFAGIIVDLFSKGSVIPELQDPKTWERLRRSLRRGGSVMVNVGGGCVEAEDSTRDGEAVMEETLMAMNKAFGGKVIVLSLGRGHRKDDSSIALAFEGNVAPNRYSWKEMLPSDLQGFVDMWMPTE